MKIKPKTLVIASVSAIVFFLTILAVAANLRLLKRF